ncbi:hypothetical protein KY346_03985 [Candidatus Woesearchaeota archaeon]|nr:hypothetical protein [Candidatus Woesearchaeota archaeon]
MKIDIKNKKENPLLSRIEVSGIIAFDGATPSNEQVSQGIAAQMKVDVSVVKMKNIRTSMGSHQAEFLAFVYNTKADLDKIEPKPKKQVEKEQKKAEAAKKAAEAPKEEAKPEEKKEEAKPEEKKEAPKEENKETAPEKKEEAKPEEKKEAKPEEKKEGAE